MVFFQRKQSYLRFTIKKQRLLAQNEGTLPLRLNIFPHLRESEKCRKLDLYLHLEKSRALSKLKLRNAKLWATFVA